VFGVVQKVGKMKTAILTFPSVMELQDFLKSTNSKTIEYNINTCILIVQCTDAEIELAKNAYNAEVDELKNPSQ
jgi:hypothetical protein